jgi:uncharacterized membrane protein YqjE
LQIPVCGNHFGSAHAVGAACYGVGRRTRAPKQTLLLTLLLFFSLSFGFILLNIFAVALFWEKGWVLALGGLAVLYLGVGVVAALMLRKKILNRPGLFPATLAELEKDRDRLKAASRE